MFAKGGCLIIGVGLSIVQNHFSFRQSSVVIKAAVNVGSFLKFFGEFVEECVFLLCHNKKVLKGFVGRFPAPG